MFFEVISSDFPLVAIYVTVYTVYFRFPKSGHKVIQVEKDHQVQLLTLLYKIHP